MKIDVVYNKSCQRMTELPDGSIDMCMTSPPYWGLRDYGEDVKEIWGGDKDCEHDFETERTPRPNASGGKDNPFAEKLKIKGVENYSEFADYHDRATYSQFCVKCGAWHGQLGLEPTLEMYIEHLLLITLECKRVLKPTGVMWWNHGDSYFTGKGSCKNPGGGNKSWKSWNDRKSIYPRGRSAPNRMSKEHPPKCLALQNYRLVIRMIDEQGWILRNNAIWNKPNSMPSSVKDRLANKYEPVFCLVKNTKPQYYWNEKTALMADRKPKELKEEIDWEWRECSRCLGKGRIEEAICPRCKGIGKIKHSFWHSLGYWYDLDAIREPYTEPLNRWGGPKTKETDRSKGDQFAVQERPGRERRPHEAGKNPGDVWTIPTQPRPEAHFATFPDKLTIKPILATCPAEICKKCGKARVRISKREIIGEIEDRPYCDNGQMKSGGRVGTQGTQHSTLGQQDKVKRETIGWTDCGCNAGWDSGILLDPFAGRGTALEMAKKLGRHYVGYELKKEYCEKLIKPALEEIDPLFNWKTPSPAAG